MASRSRRGALALAIPAMAAFSLALPAAAAPLQTPTPASVVTVDDMATLIVPPPDPAYKVKSVGPKSIDEIAAEGAHADLAKLVMQGEGFVRAYDELWIVPSRGQVLLEDVEEFTLDSGATHHYNAGKTKDGRDPGNKGAIDSSAVPGSYAEHFTDSSGIHWDLVVFHKGNLVAYVGFGAVTGASIGGNVVAQAGKMYALFPANTLAQPTAAESAARGAGYIFGALLFLIVPILVVVFIVRAVRRRPRPVPLPGTGGGYTLSPDGRFYWDGTAWRLVGEPAPNSPLQPPPASPWQPPQPQPAPEPQAREIYQPQPRDPWKT